MSFTSLGFWAFCLAVVGVYYITPHRYRWACLLAASYVFYGTFGLDVPAVLIGLTAVVYTAARFMERTESKRRRRILLAVCVGVPIGALIVFKYLNLFWETIQSVGNALLQARPIAPLSILAPIGISFYVFKLVSYSLDVYHRKVPVERHAGYFALYVAFFPQILAGPIERPGQFLPQVRQPVAFDLDRLLAGGRLVAWGLFKKMVIADRLAYYVGEVFLAPKYKGLHLLLGAYCYYFQIYCDFSGYSDISTGVSRMLGLSAPKNFDYPYLSRDVSQFWTRWHITLSSWLRDYLFLPIAYAVMRRFEADRWLRIPVEGWSYAIGMSVTMLLGGLWHGAAWTFVAWGALHGVFLVTSFGTKGLRRRVVRAIRLNRLPRLHRAISIFLTFQLVTLAWILFRATSFENAWTYLRYMQFRLPHAGRVNLFLSLGLVCILLGLEYVQRHVDELTVLERVPVEVKAVGCALFVVILIAFSVDTSNAFIYFKF
ncbi:MAG TPA: MBOAT family O-acyltransferase [Vicinamibacterales bacterium]|jgi:D-alanyl-lipoteichoic acid acyltransferase DltB (MBOAT superfamily)